MSRLLRAIGEDWPIYLAGALIGYTLASIWRQTDVLERLLNLAREQRRMAIAQAQRELAKEHRTDA